MPSIEIRPEQLRQIADDLRQHASNVQTQVDETNAVLRRTHIQEALKGNRADQLFTRFHRQLGHMDTWDRVMRDFAAMLNEAANAFEDADRGGSGTGGGVKNPPTQTPVDVPKTETQYTNYTVVKGDTLWAIAKRYGTTVDAIVAANNIPNRDLIYPGQVFKIPTGEVPVDPGTKNTTPSVDVGDSPRTPGQYAAHIDKYNVEGNHRYAKNRDGKGYTYCNLYVHDVAKGLGAEIPLFVKDNNNATKWLGATAMKKWLDGKLDVPGSYAQGPESGWVKVDHATAAAAANNGQVAVAAGHGHMAMVRPGTPAGAGPGDVMISQAGAKNFNNGPLSNGWGPYTPEAEFYVFKG